MQGKSVILILALITPAKQYAQSSIDRTIPVRAGQTIDMHFDYPELIRVTTWDRYEISITGSVNINGGENDDAFLLESSSDGPVVKIRSEIKGLKDLPHRIVVTDGERKIMFKDKAELEKYQQANGKNYSSISWGPEIDVLLEIRIPRGTKTDITSVYGFVEVTDFTGPLTVEATYGGVDAALTEDRVGELTAETGFGQIYSNLNLKFSDEAGKSRDFHTFVSARPGSGPRYSFESKYGNVYLRRAGN